MSLEGFLKACINVFMFLAAPALTFLLSEFLLRNPFEYVYGRAVPLNLAIYYLSAALIMFIFGSLRTGLISVTLWSMFFSTVNMYVYRFRSSPLVPWDIRSVGTAMSVAKDYDWSLDRQKIIIYVIALILVICEWYFAGFTLGRPLTKRKLLIRISGAAVSALLMSLLFMSLWDWDMVQHRYRLYDKLFTPDTMQYRDGTAVAFVMELKFLFPEIPEGYSEERAESILAPYAGQPEGGRKPNVIVIMDEAFSDPALNGEFTVNTDYMPFVKELMNGAENTVSGDLNVSVRGGNTPNSEFEFLTGNTMAFLTDGSIPFQQYLSGFTPSIVSWFEELGYETTGMHPYKPKGWNRDKVYSWLGFDYILFENDFKESGHSEILREFISDRADFEMVIDTFQKNRDSSGRPQLIFNVTMQNHSPYSKRYVNFKPDVFVDGIEEGASINTYLSLVKASDSAFRDLVSYFGEQEDDTVIVFFGDHQPADSVVSPVWKMNGLTGADLTPEQKSMRYIVPFVIWANYDINERTGLDISANYLSAVMCETCGITLSPYQAFLLDVMRDYPVVSAKRVSDGSGGFYSVDEMRSGLSDYAVVQYYWLFGKKEK